ncbi:MAG: right-handed parallel beta-helix repeat-containing protein, partial [Deltaproteobacteria bacterium]|nr:right-handed parallel beta-helix repeat-containing protein [Deltaproteobacteria bacterium]
MKKIAVYLIFMLVLGLTGCDDSNNNNQDNNSGNNNDSFFPYGNPVDIDFGQIVAVNTFYVDPVNGSNDGDGSLENPWKDLQEVINTKVATLKYEELPWTESGELVSVNSEQPVKGGDEIVLRDGYYGALLISESFNERYITIRAMEDETPLFSEVEVHSAAKWVLRGLNIDGSKQEEPGSSTLLSIKYHNYFGPVSRILVDNCRLFSTPDISAWTAADWNQLSCNGIEIRGSHVQVQNNLLRNVNFGITVNGSNVTVKDNTIENFSGDGLRGLGQNLLFEGNLVKNCYDVNDNHDDGFQSWSVEGQTVSRIVLRGNTFINFEDPQQPLRGPLQGIGCFDGFYEDWLVENNLVIVDHWHGITFLGAKNVKVRNNTVITADLDTERTPWIMID